MGLVQGDRVIDLASAEEGIRSALDILAQGKTFAGVATRVEWLARRLRGRGLAWAELQRGPTRRAPHLLLPLEPAEVWTTRADGGPPTPAQRPALFFKATAARCAGPYAALGLRPDSMVTLPLPGVAVALGAAGEILGYTGYVGLSAVDLERESAHFADQARIYPGCCGLGPWLVTPDELRDLQAVEVRMAIRRGDITIFSGRLQPLDLERLSELAGWLKPVNRDLLGTVLGVEGRLEVPDAAALRDGDEIDVEIQRIGKLTMRVSARRPRRLEAHSRI